MPYPIYHNTNREDGETLWASIEFCKTQEQAVLAFFRANPGKYYTNYEIHDRLMPQAEKTSSQRCLTNLTQAGLLIKTDFMTTAPSGKKVHTWTLKIEQNGQLRMF